jgi:hypothetical protein
LLRFFPVTLVIAAAIPSLLDAADDNKPEPRTPVGKHVTATGMLLQREPGKAWQAVKESGNVFSGDMLVGLPGATLLYRDSEVRLELLSDLEGTSPFPVLEAAVVLHAPAKADFDFTLGRGRVTVINRKAKGPAVVRVRFRKEVWELTLTDSGAAAGLELYGRWPKGVYFKKDANPPDEPTAELVLIALKGSADLKYGNKQIALAAPPGPAFFHWDSVRGPDAGPQRLEKLPDWADPNAKPSPTAKEKQERLVRLQKRLATEPVDKVIATELKSKDAGDRRVGVIALGALDDLPGLADAFNNTEHADVRENVIMVVRHWLGRGPGQDLKFYNFLVNERKYRPAHAEIALRLLHSFGDTDLAKPETYEALIAYLMHERLGIREMAKWQLYRLVPAGKDIAYDAAAPEKERQAAQDKWKKLIPEGKLPEKPKP